MYLLPRLVCQGLRNSTITGGKLHFLSHRIFPLLQIKYNVLCKSHWFLISGTAKQKTWLQVEKKWCRTLIYLLVIKLTQIEIFEWVPRYLRYFILLIEVTVTLYSGFCYLTALVTSLFLWGLPSLNVNSAIKYNGTYFSDVKIVLAHCEWIIMFSVL